jgi:hypothetical protein
LKREPTTHEFTVANLQSGEIGLRVIQGDKLRLRAFGATKGIQPGDFIILPNFENTTRYVVEEIRYLVSGMYGATFKFSPRGLDGTEKAHEAWDVAPPALIEVSDEVKEAAARIAGMKGKK